MLSVVLATHNEAKNLPACLEAIKSIATEIIIVDGQSSDETVEIAKQFGAQVISTTNKANFHINKQMAMDAASKELILQLDADEVVDEELRQFIVQIDEQISQGNYDQKTQAVAWWIRRKNFFCGRFLRKGGQYPDPVIRLYINGKARLPAKDVHEQMEVDGAVATAEGHLLHYSNPSFKEYLRKFATYTFFKATQLREADLAVNPLTAFKYLIWLPLKTFTLIYLRHKGFVDSWQGLVFAIFSALHHPIAYLKYLESRRQYNTKISTAYRR